MNAQPLNENIGSAQRGKHKYAIFIQIKKRIHQQNKDLWKLCALRPIRAIFFCSKNDSPLRSLVNTSTTSSICKLNKNLSALYILSKVIQAAKVAFSLGHTLKSPRDPRIWLAGPVRSILTWSPTWNSSPSP